MLPPHTLLLPARLLSGRNGLRGAWPRPAAHTRPASRLPPGGPRKPERRLRGACTAIAGTHILLHQDSLSDTGERGRKPFFSSRKGGFFLFFSSFLLLCAAGRTGSVPRRVPPRGREGALPDTSGHTFRGLNLLTASRIHLPADDVGHSDAKYTVGCVHRNPSLVPQQGDEAPHTADAPPPPPGQIAQRRHHLSMLHPDATMRHDNLRRFGGKTGHHVQVDQRGRLTVRLLFLPDGTIQEFTRNENKSVFHIHSF